MKHLLTIFLLLILVCECRAQISRRQLRNDFDLFTRIYEKANAGLYKHHSKQEIDSTFRANRKLIQKHTSYREFYTIVWKVIDFTGSCHNELSFPYSLKKELRKQKIFFPLPLKYLNHKLYSNLEYKTIPLGSELLSVNGIAAKDFAIEVSRYTSTDGYNLTGKYAFLETGLLFFYIYLAYGEQDSFTITYRDGSEIKQQVLEPLDYKDALENYRTRFIPAYHNNQGPDYFFHYTDSSKTGLLTVNTFGLGGPKSEGHKNYAAFLDSVFTDLKTHPIQNLIVDIRENGGGNDPNDLLLYSYLTKRNFRENRSAFTLFNSVPFKQFYVEEETDEIADLEKDLKSEHNIRKNNRFYQNEQLNPVWIPKTNAFTGKLYLLVSPFVASAGSLFAGMVKSDEESVVVGQETLGGYYGHTGHISVSYQLPETGLLLTFSIVDLEQDVQELPDQKKGEGIKPDFTVEQTIEEYLEGRDMVLEFARNLIHR
ncbi:S41 family peptidase [Fluviicola chungangensis]|uniref:Peptidase n=1 Tax=Fluviicola chungangensis TaxID=2597671 RepID=A0A556MNQ5_9FLAO|nr:S41 family peptidase [Fluviicola chungangensis]TSJ41597.1 peptidase [Fluviicola chungangensis]